MSKKRQIKQEVRDFGTQGAEVSTYTSGDAEYDFDVKMTSPAIGHKSAQVLEMDIGGVTVKLSGRKLQSLRAVMERHDETYDSYNY